MHLPLDRFRQVVAGKQQKSMIPGPKILKRVIPEPKNKKSPLHLLLDGPCQIVAKKTKQG